MTQLDAHIITINQSLHRFVLAPRCHALLNHYVILRSFHMLELEFSSQMKYCQCHQDIQSPFNILIYNVKQIVPILTFQWLIGKFATHGCAECSYGFGEGVVL